MVHGEGLGDDGAEALVNVPLHLAGGAVAWMEASSVREERGLGDEEALALMMMKVHTWLLLALLHHRDLPARVAWSAISTPFDLSFLQHNQLYANPSILTPPPTLFFTEGHPVLL
jgi:hypothetical protein